MAIRKSYARRVVPRQRTRVGMRAIPRPMLQVKLERGQAQEAPPVSRYHEDRVVYRRKRAPQAVKRAARRNTQRVTRVLDRFASKATVKASQFSLANTVGGTIGYAGTATQNVMASELYSYNGQGGQDDIYQIANKLYGMNPASGALAPDFANIKFVVSSAIMDIDLTADAANTYPACVDIYECIARKDIALNDYSSLLTINGPETGLGSSISGGIGNPECSLFDFKPFTEAFVILKKRDLVIAPGDNMRFQIRDTKPRYIAGGDMFSGAPYLGKKGMMRIWVSVVRGAVYNNAGVANYAPVKVTLVARKSYTVRPLGVYKESLGSLA